MECNFTFFGVDPFVEDTSGVFIFYSYKIFTCFVCDGGVCIYLEINVCLCINAVCKKEGEECENGNEGKWV